MARRSIQSLFAVDLSRMRGFSPACVHASRRVAYASCCHDSLVRTTAQSALARQRLLRLFSPARINVEGLSVAFIASLLLGMRHATDADHIVAITTIVNREHGAWRSSRIGLLWGLGHTVTILVVGSAIILFKLAFTARVGLSLEFCVAMMLMVLGYLNLTHSGAANNALPQLRPFVVGVVHGMAGSAAA